MANTTENTTHHAEAQTSQASRDAAAKPKPKRTKPVILLNRTRGRVMIPQPRTDTKGNPQKFACDIHVVHAGLNLPISPEIWALLREGRFRHKLDGHDPELRVLKSPTDIPDMVVDQILQNCGHPPAVEWWLEQETREPVREKLQAWIKKIKAKQAKRRGAA
jgi:hypothetical protein